MAIITAGSDCQVCSGAPNLPSRDHFCNSLQGSSESESVGKDALCALALAKGAAPTPDLGPSCSFRFQSVEGLLPTAGFCFWVEAG